MDNTLTSLQDSAKEEERIAKLYGYNITKEYVKSGTFQHVVGMAAHIFNVPIALINFQDKEHALIDSSIGLDGYDIVDRDVTLCSQAILREEVTVFRNAKEEPCLSNNPFVHGDFGLRFYAGAPIRTLEGYCIGVLGIGDTKPRDFTTEDEDVLEGLAAIIVNELEENKRRTEVG
ncbi:GAF domain-containing protein [Pontibacter korlensis]|uniref:GAF domain-containing protein n=1 Tax=Pontibacter korlensis TaxID=400092 RepID=A0A0E3ZH25_9BACT|nr:GAF domain-containing protein [Pontibacter korlensis]AKD04219.1 hypothetical protein PKOR_15415 [Pontibacter korlensis]